MSCSKDDASKESDEVANDSADDPTTRKRRRVEGENAKEPKIPALTLKNGDVGDEFWDTFGTYKVVLLPQVSKTPSNDTLTWKHIRDLFESLADSDKESWCIENAKNASDKSITPQDFLKPEKSNHFCGYCSFLVQNDKNAMEQSLNRLPLSDLPCSRPRDQSPLRYGPCLWLFFGRNSDNIEMQGRPEHTDAVSHDGTWHYQLSGTKTWHLRPTMALLDQLKEKLAPIAFDKWSKSPGFKVTCQEGDVLVINTRLWWHRTVIESQPSGVPSVSYARDFFVSSSQTNSGVAMTNVDGLYAANEIQEGTVIFTEQEMPDCELHRSTNPNCEVVELDDGTGAVVSSRVIAAGEFFCVPESSDEKEEEVEYEEEEDDNEDAF